MAEAVREEHGIIDKYIGDAVMAFWGPPFVEEASQAAHACRAAVRQMARLTDLRAALPSILGDLPGGVPPLNIRIGLATGMVTVGSVGSDMQRNYTVIGDSVNLASRLEAANKVYGTSILVDEGTREAARDVVETREVDRIRVVGRNEPVRIYEVLGLKAAVDADLLDFCAGFEAALGVLRGGDIAEARRAFEGSAARRPGDGPTRLFLERLGRMGAAGLPAGWDGVWNLDSK
jgi:adenylate cyclase